MLRPNGWQTWVMALILEQSDQPKPFLGSLLIFNKNLIKHSSAVYKCIAILHRERQLFMYSIYTDYIHRCVLKFHQFIIRQIFGQ